MDITPFDQAIAQTSSARSKDLPLASIARLAFMNEMKEAATRSESSSSEREPSRLKSLAFRPDPLPAPRWQASSRDVGDKAVDQAERPDAETETTDTIESADGRKATEQVSDTGPTDERGSKTAQEPAQHTVQQAAVAPPAEAQAQTPPQHQTVPSVPASTPLPVSHRDGSAVLPPGAAPSPVSGPTTPAAASTSAPPQQPPSGQNPSGQNPSGPPATAQTPAAEALALGARPATPTATAAQVAGSKAASGSTPDGSSATKPLLDGGTPVKITVESGAQPAGPWKSSPATAGALIQAQQATASATTQAPATLAQQGVTLPGLGQGPASAATTPNANGGQPLFVGADGGSTAQNAGAQTGQGQNGGQQGSQNGGQGTTGQPGFQFGQASFGKNGSGGEAARAQFQDIMMTRTARPSALGNAPETARPLPLSGTNSSVTTTSSVTAGPGGPQSTFSATMASNVAQATPGRPGATPGAAVDQVAVKLSSSAKNGGGKISIRLNPEELGKVDVKLEIGRDGMVRATVSADRPETLDMMQRDARALEKALQDAGLKTDSDSLQFEGRDGQGAAGQQNAQDDTGASGATASNEVADEALETDTDTGDGLADDGSLNLVA